MSKYIDIYLVPVPKKNLAAYKKVAKMASRVFRKHGALSYFEYEESDVKKIKGIRHLPTALKAKKGEVIVYGHVTFKSEKHRNRCMKKIYADAAMATMMPKPLFDVKRMVYGGFKVLVKG